MLAISILEQICFIFSVMVACDMVSFSVVLALTMGEFQRAEFWQRSYL